jgi:hypothetical protein
MQGDFFQMKFRIFDRLDAAALARGGKFAAFAKVEAMKPPLET